MQRFFSENIKENRIELDRDESKHLSKVLRLKAGAEVEVIDGKGNLYYCSVWDSNDKKSILNIQRNIYLEEKYFLSIAAAPTKNLNRWEWFLEKATEIGIDSISPITSNNSERKVLKKERQEKILLSAVKQSLKLHIPQLQELQSFSKLIKQTFDGDKFIAHCAEDADKIPLFEACKAGKNTLILIGPEGDFTKEEIKLAKSNAFRAISLGKSRLRTETAAVVACQIVNLKNE